MAWVRVISVLCVKAGEEKPRARGCLLLTFLMTGLIRHPDTEHIIRFIRNQDKQDTQPAPLKHQNDANILHTKGDIHYHTFK